MFTHIADINCAESKINGLVFIAGRLFGNSYTDIWPYMKRYRTLPLHHKVHGSVTLDYCLIYAKI